MISHETKLALATLIVCAGCTDQASSTRPQSSPTGGSQPTIETIAPDTVTATEPTVETHAVLYKVIKIVDGDTIDVLTSGKQTVRLRFNGIDCPERGQPFGNNATKFVSDTVGGKMVRLVTHGDDKYGRTIADIYLPVSDADNPAGVVMPDLFLNRELVKRGLAWHYKKYSDDERLASDEDNARQQKSGLWGGSHKVIAPWDWRKLSKEERDEFR